MENDYMPVLIVLLKSKKHISVKKVQFFFVFLLVTKFVFYIWFIFNNNTIFCCLVRFLSNKIKTNNFLRMELNKKHDFLIINVRFLLDSSALSKFFFIKQGS